MTDTSVKTSEKMRQLMSRKSGLERLKMGADMFDMAKKLVLISLSKSGTNVRSELFLRFYGRDFDKAQKRKILKYFGA